MARRMVWRRERCRSHTDLAANVGGDVVFFHLLRAQLPVQQLLTLRFDDLGVNAGCRFRVGGVSQLAQALHFLV